MTKEELNKYLNALIKYDGSDLHIKAGNGKPGGGQNKTGSRGNDVIIDVPLGTTAKFADTGEFILE